MITRNCTIPHCFKYREIDSDFCKDHRKVTEESEEKINHPPHYTSDGIEAIDVIEAFQLNFCLGNTIKYLLRAGRKDSTAMIEDLKKAAWYLEREIAKEMRDAEKMDWKKWIK